MNYQGIVNRIQSITNQHKMLADFGYGDLSDLKSRFENTSGNSAVQADYPYLFLNPGVHQRNQGMVTYNFNMIVMDMAREEVSDDPYNNMLAIQSQCQQYIDDVLAYLYHGYTDTPDVIYSGVTYIPFNERFQDDVAGMTATLTIQIPQPIDNCITPFTSIVPPEPPEPVICDPEYPNFATSISQFNNTVDTGHIAWFFGSNTVSDPAIGTWSSNVFNNAVLGTFEFIIEADITFTNPTVGETFPPAPTLLVNNVIDIDANCEEDNWPTSYIAGTFRYKARYSVNLQALAPVQIISTTQTFAGYTLAVGATLNIGYQA